MPTRPLSTLLSTPRPSPLSIVHTSVLLKGQAGWGWRLTRFYCAVAVTDVGHVCISGLPLLACPRTTATVLLELRPPLLPLPDLAETYVMVLLLLIMMTLLKYGVVVVADPDHHGRDFHLQMLLAAWVTAVHRSVFHDCHCHCQIVFRL